MSRHLSRRSALKWLAAVPAGVAASQVWPNPTFAAKKNPAWEKAIKQGLDWVARTQSPIRGNWTAGNYPTAMTALAGTALICSGSTTTQGPYAKNIRRSVDYLLTRQVYQKLQNAGQIQTRQLLVFQNI